MKYVPSLGPELRGLISYLRTTRTVGGFERNRARCQCTLFPRLRKGYSGCLFNLRHLFVGSHFESWIMRIYRSVCGICIRPQRPVRYYEEVFPFPSPASLISVQRIVFFQFIPFSFVFSTWMSQYQDFYPRIIRVVRLCKIENRF